MSMVEIAVDIDAIANGAAIAVEQNAAGKAIPGEGMSARRVPSGETGAIRAASVVEPRKRTRTRVRDGGTGPVRLSGASAGVDG